VPEKLIATGDWQAVRARFHERHDRLYGYALREEGARVELLNLRLTATGMTDKAPLRRERRRPPDPSFAGKGRRRAYCARRGKFVTMAVYDGERLAHGNRVAGPAIIESVNTTIVVPAGSRATYDALGNCILEAR